VLEYAFKLKAVEARKIFSERILKASVFAGYLMLANGAETARVEETIERILSSAGFKNVGIFVSFTSIITGFDDEQGNAKTMIKRVGSRGYNLSKIAKINDISRSYVSKEITLDDVEQKLSEVENEKGYPMMAKTLASAIACFCFSYMLGQNVVAAANAFFIGIIVSILMLGLSSKNLSPYLITLAAGCAISSVAVLFVHLGLNQFDSIDIAIIGSILPYLPGIAMTNAIRDIFCGNYVSGICRGLEAVFIALCLSAGVGTILGIYMFYIA